MRLQNMWKDMSKLYDLFLIAIVLLIIALILGVRFNTETETDKEITKRTTFVDTISYYVPVPKDSFVIRYVTEKLPKTESKLPNDVKKSPQNGEKLPEVHKIGKFLCEDEIFPDSVEVEIPISQTVYEDSSYTAYISGYRAQLDSLIFRQKREVVTITKWKPPKRWSIGIQAGYGASRHGMEPYIGIGVSYNLFSF